MGEKRRRLARGEERGFRPINTSRGNRSAWVVFGRLVWDSTKHGQFVRVQHAQQMQAGEGV